jgi:CBS-domain-containing membrane protein
MTMKLRAGQLAIVAYRAIGAGIAISTMEIFADLADEPLSRVPFVTSIVLVTALPDSDPAQPRAVIFGHLMSCFAGVAAHVLFGTGEIATAVAVGLATLMMVVTRSLHPPAGIDAFLLASQDLPAHWLLFPVLAGSVLIAAFARLWSMGERKWYAALLGCSDE